ncbi:MAG: signal peptidase I [Candidatus Hydrogenedentes bacterium]|nr:signal peptidase I [Candidatus Hydrogenedentota bacterium]
MSEPTPETPAAKPANIKAEFTELVKMVVWFLVLFFALKFFVIEGYEVQGPSMEPTLWNNERILVFKLPHKLSQLIPSYQPIKPGNIVVFERTEDSGKRYVKRVIAEGVPRQNGNTVDAQGRNDTGPPAVSLRIEDGKVFVNNQRVVESYLPVEVEESFDDSDRAELKPGEYYVMGDHRSVSKDSRVFGPVNDDKVIGKAILRFWPLSRFGLLK